MGEATLVSEMSDSTQIKCYVESGSAVPYEISQYIWVAGSEDLYLNGAWTFDNTLNLYYEDGLKYNGIMSVYSEWGYLLYTEKENWGYAIGKNKEDGSSESGTLATEDFENIPAPSQGLYMVEADMKNMSYSTYEITSVTYVGVNDNWDLQSLPQDPENLEYFQVKVRYQNQ